MRQSSRFRLSLIMCCALALGAVAALAEARILPEVFIQAVRDGKTGTAEDLLRQGADPNVRGPEANTPLHYAAQNGNSRLAEQIIIRGGSVNAVNDKGQTPLHLAAERGKAEMVQSLIRFGADPGIRDNEGERPVDLARKAGHPEMDLVIHGQAVNQSVPGGRSVRLNWLCIMLLLFFALVVGIVKFIQWLLHRNNHPGSSAPNSGAVIQTLLFGLDRMERRTDNLETILKSVDPEAK